MEDSRKKPIMIGVIVVCVVAAVAITLSRRGGGGGIGEIASDEMVWVKCNNPACKAEYQTGKRAFFEERSKRFDPSAETVPAVICKECGKPSVYEAVKCANPSCGIIFFKGASGPGDFSDRCPKCKYSAMEESREQRKRELGG